MTEARRSTSGEPPINFLAHQTRGGLAGATEDFEQMLALLAQTIEGDARLVFANPGDWGIDVLIGQMSGEVTIWQAKYYVPGVATKHQNKIKDSFDSALRRAHEHGYRVRRWVLCVPSSLDPSVTKWWDSWREQQQDAHRLSIELWDETRLRTLLSQSAAAQIRRLYYNPYRNDHDGQSDPAPAPSPARADVSTVAPWRGGNEHRFGADSYLLHDDVVEQPSPDRCWVWREATAHQIEGASKKVRLRQFTVLQPGSDAAERSAALHRQATLLRELTDVKGLPHLVTVYQHDDSATVVTTRPPGPTWREVFGPGRTAADPLTAAAVLAAAAEVSDLLARLHTKQLSHRALSPDTILLDDRTGTARLRDIGLAGIPPWVGEGSEVYRAPEQFRPWGLAGTPGPPTDVYQLGAVVYHTLTGHPVSPSGSPPISAAVQGFPTELDNLIRRVLETDVRQRPTDLGGFAAALRRARGHLSRGGQF
jgi:hypothetical protein